MKKRLKVSVFLCDGYSMLDVVSAVHKFSTANRLDRTSVEWKFHALDPSPTPVEKVDFAPKHLHPVSESGSPDLVILALPEGDVGEAEIALAELEDAGVQWSAIILLGAPAPQSLKGPVMTGNAAKCAEDALSLFDVPYAEGGAWRETNPFELLDLDPTYLSDLVKNALQMMASYLDEPIPIENLAERLDVSLRQLHRRFKRELDEAPLAIYRRLRVEVGRQLLEQSSNAITSIAHACGFADGPHFARSFQRIHQRSPQAHRKAMQRPDAAPADGLSVRLSIVGVENHTYKCLLPMEEFARRVRARSNGRIQVQVLSHRDVGVRPNELLKALETGRADAALLMPEMCGADPHFSALLPQAVLQDGELNNDLGQVQEPIFLDGLNAHRLSMLSKFSDYEYQNFWFFSKRPVHSLKDLKGRVLGHWSDLGVDAFKRLDVNVVKVNYASIRQALLTDELDVALGLPRFAVSHNLAAATAYAAPAMAVTRHYPNILACRAETLQKLPKEHVAVLREVGDAMRLETDMRWKTGIDDEMNLSMLRHQGMTFADRIDASDLEDIQGCMVDRWIKACASFGDTPKRCSVDVMNAIM